MKSKAVRIGMVMALILIATFFAYTLNQSNKEKFDPLKPANGTLEEKAKEAVLPGGGLKSNQLSETKEGNKQSSELRGVMVDLWR